MGIAAARNDGPLATLLGARDAIRRLKQTGQLTEAVKVVVAEGQYDRNLPLELDSKDTGTEQAPITYEAAKGAHPVFSDPDCHPWLAIGIARHLAYSTAGHGCQALV